MMEREQANAIISLARLDDWNHLMKYVEDITSDLSQALTYIEPTDALQISKVQGSINALRQISILEESALEAIGGDQEVTNV